MSTIQQATSSQAASTSANAPASSAQQPTSSTSQPTSSTIQTAAPEKSYIEMITDVFWSVVGFFKYNVLCCFFPPDPNGSNTTPPASTNTPPASNTTPASTTTPGSTTAPLTHEERVQRVEQMLQAFTTFEPVFPADQTPTEEITEGAHAGQTNQVAWDTKQANWIQETRNVAPALQNAFDAQRDANFGRQANQVAVAMAADPVFRTYRTFTQNQDNADDLQHVQVTNKIQEIRAAIAGLLYIASPPTSSDAATI